MTPLLRMTRETPTELWNDGCELRSLGRAITARGATGATTNPVLVLAAIEADPERWRDVARSLLRAHPDDSDHDLAWRLVAHAAREAAALLFPIFEQSGGRRGRLSVQTDPALHRSTARMVAQGLALSRLAPNVAVKIPAVPAGIAAMEELTARGVVVNATVSFSVSQALAAAEAIERGLARAPGDRDAITPWVTIMVGRIDDHLRDEVRERAIPIDPELVRHASTAIFRRAHRLFEERGLHATLLAAAMRSHHHWSELVGARTVITIPPEWQDRFDATGIEPRPRIRDEVDPAIVQELAAKLPDFVRAYEPGALPPHEIESFGATVKTLRQFLGAVDRLVAWVRDVALPLAPASERPACAASA